eukprot:1002028-Pelagomonas_calceolata.AAC.3
MPPGSKDPAVAAAVAAAAAAAPGPLQVLGWPRQSPPEGKGTTVKAHRSLAGQIVQKVRPAHGQ